MTNPKNTEASLTFTKQEIDVLIRHGDLLAHRIHQRADVPASVSAATLKGLAVIADQQRAELERLRLALKQLATDWDEAGRSEGDDARQANLRGYGVSGADHAARLQTYQFCASELRAALDTSDALTKTEAYSDDWYGAQQQRQAEAGEG